MWWELAAAAANYFSNERNNRANARESQKNRDFQEDMSSTAYQRSAMDLQRAGLNRILALGNPASTPGGAQANMQRSDIGSDYVRAASAKQQMSQSKAETALTVQKGAESASAENLNRVAEITQATQQALNQSTARAADAAAQVSAETARKVRLEADRLEMTNPLYKTGGDVIEYLDDKARTVAKHAGELPRKLKEFYNENAGALDRKIESIINVKPTVESVTRQKWPKFKRGSKK